MEPAGAEGGLGAGRGDAGEVLELHRRAAEQMGRLIGGVGPGEMGAATPCAEWDVRALLNHVVGGNRMAAAVAAGEAPPPAPPPGADVLGEDPAGAFAASAEAARAALADPGLPGRTVRMRFGEVPGATLLGLRVVELAVHGWDLARATGQEGDLDQGLCEAALGMARAGMEGRPREGAPFAPEVAVPGEAPACERLAGYLGRGV